MWGCVTYYRTTDPKRSILVVRARKSVFIGYAHNNKAYRLLDNKSGVVVESKDVEFFKDKFSKDIENSNPIKFPSTSQENVRPSLVIEEPRRNTRSRKDKNLGDDFYSFD